MENDEVYVSSMGRDDGVVEKGSVSGDAEGTRAALVDGGTLQSFSRHTFMQSKSP